MCCIVKCSSQSLKLLSGSVLTCHQVFLKTVLCISFHVASRRYHSKFVLQSVSPIENTVRGIYVLDFGTGRTVSWQWWLVSVLWMTTSGRNATAGVGEGCSLTSSCTSMGISELKRTGLGQCPLYMFSVSRIEVVASRYCEACNISSRYNECCLFPLLFFIYLFFFFTFFFF